MFVDGKWRVISSFFSSPYIKQRDHGLLFWAMSPFWKEDIDDGHAVITPRKEGLLFISQRKKDLLFLWETKGCCILPFFSAVRFFSSKGNLLLRYLYGFTVSGGKLFPGLGSLQEFIIMQYAAGRSPEKHHNWFFQKRFLKNLIFVGQMKAGHFTCCHGNQKVSLYLAALSPDCSSSSSYSRGGGRRSYLWKSEEEEEKTVSPLLG